MLKQLIIVGVLGLAGCASQPRPADTLQRADMKNFVANCKIARVQIDNLNQLITEYQEYFKTHTVTREDQRYYGRLKNNIWSLRSSCSKKYL